MFSTIPQVSENVVYFIKINMNDIQVLNNDRHWTVDPAELNLAF